MANSLAAIMPKILARGMLTLRQQCYMPGLVNSDYSTEFKAKGDTIDIPIPVAQVAADVTPSNVSPAPASTTPTKVQLSLDYWKMTDFMLTDKELGAIDKNAHFLPGQVNEAFKALANAVNVSIWSKYTGVYGYVGTAGTTPFASTAAAAISARKTLHQQLAPRENRVGVLDFDAEANALALAAFADAEKTGENGVKIRGEIGTKYGIRWLADDHTPTHTAGTGSGYLLNDSGGCAIGETVITVDTGSGTILVGDIVTFAGHTQTYAVTVALSGSTFTISPPLVAAVADNAAITLKASHVVNMAFHRDALAFATRVLESDAQELSFTMQDPLTKLVCRLERVRQHKQTSYQIDMLWGTGLVNGALACRIAG